MFCPQEVAWGNVADWVSGLGASAAVIGAVWIAKTQERFAKHMKKVEAAEAHEKKAHLISEVLRLSGEIEAQASRGKSYINAERAVASWKAVIDDINDLRASLDDIQQLAKAEPLIFGEIGRISRESKIEYNLEVASPAYAAHRFGEIIAKVQKRREVLLDLLK